MMNVRHWMRPYEERPSSGPRGFTTLVVDTGRDPLVGATAAGPAGGEVLGMLALAVHGRLLVDRLSMMIFT